MKIQQKIKFYIISLIIIISYLIIGEYINRIPEKYYYSEACSTYKDTSINDVINKFENENLYIKYELSHLAFNCEQKNMSPLLLYYAFFPKNIINPYNIYYVPVISPYGGKIEKVNQKLSNSLGSQKFDLSILQNKILTIKEKEQLYSDFAKYWINIMEKEFNTKITEPRLIYEDPYQIHSFNFIFTFGLIILLLIYIRKKIYKK